MNGTDAASGCGECPPLDAARAALEAPVRDLVQRFSEALLAKLLASEAKYGWNNGWLDPHWAETCREQMHRHLAKGDPRDVAAYCAFMWHHGWSTATGTLPPPAPDSTATP